MSTDAALVAEPPPALHSRTKKSGSTLGRYILVRFLLIFPTVLILVTLVFFLIRLTGDPITAALGGRLPADQLAQRISEAGYDRNIFIQYFEYLGQIFTFNFGTTITDNQPVIQVIATYGAATLELVLYSLVVAFLVGIPLGLVAAALLIAGPTPSSASARSSSTRPRCFSPASSPSSSSACGSAGCPSPAARACARKSR